MRSCSSTDRLLELLTESRTRFDQRLWPASAPTCWPRRSTPTASWPGCEPTTTPAAIGDALLDQRNVAGIGNIWKSEGCWDAAIDPWRPVAKLSDSEVLAIVDALRPRMFESARTGVQDAGRRVFRRHGQPCYRCGAKIVARGQGEDNRTTFWCPGCQH